MREDKDDSEATRKNSIVADSEVPLHSELPIMPALPTPGRDKPQTDNKDLSEMMSKTTVLSEEENNIKINPITATVTLSND